MTWSAKLKVTGIDIGERYEYEYYEDDAPKETRQTKIHVRTDCESVLSNTEGELESVELSLVLVGAGTQLKVGDVISISGHFQG